MSLTCDMTLVGGEYEILGANVKDGAKVTFAGGTYKGAISVTDGTATFKGGTYYGKITVSSGEAVFESGTFNSVAVKGGTATVESGATFSATNSFAGNSNNTIEVTGGTLKVEGGTLNGKVTVELKGSLTVSNGKFTNTVTIGYTTSGACIISGGTFTNTVDVRLNTSSTGTCTISGGTFATLEADTNRKLSALLAEGCAYHDQNDRVVSGEVGKLTGVTVKSGHKHSPDENGTCDCGAQMAASVTVGDKTDYYATIEAAVTALNAVDGEKTLTLLQDRTSGSATYTLEKGPVTLDVNGKELKFATFAVKGITLTLKGEAADGSVSAVQAVGKGGKIIADRTGIPSDGNVTVRTISAKEGGQLALSAGTFRDLYVVKDGSSASLAGGTYQPESSYKYGEGPDKSTTYVGAVELLAKGYGYQIKKTDGSFAWDTSGRIQRGTDNNTYKVAKIGASFEGIYLDDKTEFSGDTYLIKLVGDKETASLKLTAKGTPADRVSYQWQVDGNWLSQDTNVYSGVKTATLRITGLDVGTYRYRVGYTLKDSDGKDALAGYSEALTVVVTKHEHNWAYSASGATITAKCTADDCYLTDGNGGSVTISAPAADTLTYDGNKKAATLTWTDWVDTAKQQEIGDGTGKIQYNGSSNNETSNLYGGSTAPADAGTYTASITIGDATAYSAAYTIRRAELTVEGTAAATAAYSEDLTVKKITISGLTVKFGSKEVNGTWKFDSSAQPEVGNTTAYTAAFKPTSTYDAGNYETLTTRIIPTITKGTYDGADMGTTKEVWTDEAQTGVEVTTGLMPNITDAKIVGATETDDKNNIIDHVTYTDNTVKFDVNSVSEAGKTATITVTYSSKNYNDFTGTITVKTVKKGQANVTITGMPETVTYGDTFTLTASQDEDLTGTNKKWAWDYDQTNFKLIGGAINSDTITLQASKARSGSDLRLTVTTADYESDTHKGRGSVQFSTIAPKELTITGVTAERRDYAPDDTSVTLNGGTLQGVVGTDTVTFELGTGTIADASAGAGKPVTTTIQLTGIGAGNYTLTQPTDIKVTIGKASWTYTNPSGLTAEYGQKLSEIKLTNPASNLPGTWKWQKPETALGQIGSQSYYADFEPEDQNYKGVKNAEINVTVGKADAPTLTDITVSQKYTVTTEQSKQIGSIMPADAGTLTYIKDTESKTGSVTVTSWDVDATGKVTFALSGGAAGDTVTLPVTITSTNYADATVKVVITLTAKDDQAALTLTGGTTVVYGQTLQLGTTGGSGTGAVTYAVTNGTGEATIDATGKLTPVKVGTVKVKATKAADASFNEATSAEVEITITRATPTGAPKYTAITTSGKTLADTGLTVTGSTLNPNAGTLVWVDDAGNVLPDTTAVAANTTYKWIFTPTDANYTTLTGSIELYHKSSSGGGGWYYTYYTIEATAGTNGSISPSGWTSVRDGRDQTFTITPDKGYAVAKVLVDGKSVGAVKSYTFKNVTKDHTIEAIFMKSNGNPQTGVFIDVAEGSYYEETIDWAVEKGITNGIGGGLFGADNDCTRGQIVTFLWRAMAE